MQLLSGNLLNILVTNITYLLVQNLSIRGEKLSFVPDDFDASKWENIEPYVNDLLSRELTCSSCLEKAISDSSNLAEHISETGALLYIGMTCDTENEKKKNEFLHFVENVRPKLSEFSDALNRRIAEHPSLEDLSERYTLMIRGIISDIEIFRTENIPLGVEQTKLVTKAQGITGAMTVEFEGKERTFPEMKAFLESNDREKREKAWKSMVNRWMDNSEDLSEIFDELIKIRHQIALNAGFDTYTDYMFRAMHRFDYSVEDCLTFHDSIEKVCMPIVKDINEKRRVAFGLEKLSPWDVNEKTGSGPDISGERPLRPFESVQDMVTKLSQLFHNMSEDLGNKFDKLVEMDTLDLETRKGKAPGGYQYYLEKSRVPFIFMNAAGLQGDLETMIHESGHAFHSLYCGHLDLIDERNYPIEFAEVASMSMELLTQDEWGIFYENSNEVNRARISHLEGVVYLLPWIATIDAFQHWIYANPDHTRDERKEYWLSLREKFGSDMNWNGNEEFRELSWQQQGHLYGVPFYYVEYGIAQLGALQLWQTHRKDPEKALIDYSNAMELGNTKTLPDLFAAAELKLGFDEKHLNSLIKEVKIAMSEII